MLLCAARRRTCGGGGPSSHQPWCPRPPQACRARRRRRSSTGEAACECSIIAKEQERGFTQTPAMNRLCSPPAALTPRNHLRTGCGRRAAGRSGLLWLCDCRVIMQACARWSGRASMQGLRPATQARARCGARSLWREDEGLVLEAGEVGRRRARHIPVRQPALLAQQLRRGAGQGGAAWAHPAQAGSARQPGSRGDRRLPAPASTRAASCPAAGPAPAGRRSSSCRARGSEGRRWTRPTTR